jgi:hypothetical protein
VSPTLVTEPRPTYPTAKSGSALATLKIGQSALSPEQQRFNKWLIRTETLARKIKAARTLADSHRPHHGNTVRPLELQRHALMREMALWLATRLQRKGLTARLKHRASDIICELAASLAGRGDSEMQALHDAHSELTLAEQEKATVEDMMRASVAHLRQQEQAQEDARVAQKSRHKKTAGQQQAEQQGLEADGALRTLYRQLVSALHPDRESDAQERTRKTALMKEVNTAYERRDLLALLQLKLKEALADGAMVTNLSQDRLRALTVLLKERATVLTHELREIEAQTLQEFQLQPDAPLTAASLYRHLQAQRDHLQDEITMMQHDLLLVQNDAKLKRWLREQPMPATQDFDGLSFNRFF